MSVAELMEIEKIDIVFPDGSHRYWSTHCRHGNHDACSATELRGSAPGVTVTIERKPAQCKTCGAGCVCECYD